ncbi:MAG: rhodanese-like domain-containing protein [Pirellula sp.]
MKPTRLWHCFVIRFLQPALLVLSLHSCLWAQGTLPTPFPGYERPALPVLESLMAEYPNSQGDRKKQIVEQIGKLVEQEFNQRHLAQQQEIKALEDQVALKRKAFEKREKLKDKIVADRVTSLLEKSEGIGWEPAVGMPNEWAPAYPALPAYPASLSIPPGMMIPPIQPPGASGTLPALAPPVLAPPALAPPVADYPKARVSYEDFKELVAEVEPHRQSRVLSLDQFLQMSKQPNVMILDTRSAFRYERIHLKGAKHLSFTDFTQSNLANAIPTPETTVLIYCNNNFDGNQVDFAPKSASPRLLGARQPGNRVFESQVAVQSKPLELALNVPTYINLYGYGYRNVYELGELVKVTDPRVQFEGSMVGDSK